MDVITAKLIVVINKLIESNEKNYNEGNGVYQGDYLDGCNRAYQDGYLDGYHDALVELLNQMHIKNDYQYYD